MSAIEDFLTKMTSLSGHKNVAFIFDPKQYDPVNLICTPSDCYLVGDINGTVATGHTYSVTYRLTGELQQPEAVLTFYSEATTKVGLLVGMVLAINNHYMSQGHLSYLIVGASGGVANFSTLIARDGIHGGDGSAGGVSITLHLSLTTGAEYDAVATLFGSNVSADSCGLKVWPGV